jgi:hypothetical protein
MNFPLARRSSEPDALARVLARVPGGDVLHGAAIAGAAGAAIGAACAKFGAEVPLGTASDGTPMARIPSAAIVAAAGYGLAVFMPEEPMTKYAQRAADVAVGIMAANIAKSVVSGNFSATMKTDTEQATTMGAKALAWENLIAKAAEGSI